MNPIDFGGQRSKVKVTMDIYGNKLVNTIEKNNVVYFFIKLGRDVYHGEKMDPFDFGGQRSKVKVSGRVWKKAVNPIQSKPLCAPYQTWQTC